MLSFELAYTPYIWLKSFHILSSSFWVFSLFTCLFIHENFKLYSKLKILNVLSLLFTLLTLISGLLLLLSYQSFSEKWLHYKFGLVLILFAIQIVWFLKYTFVLGKNDLDNFFVSKALKFIVLGIFCIIVVLVTVRPI